MKRILMLVLLVMTTLCANAQLKFGDALACTRNEVNVRTGPGSNYPIGELDSDTKTDAVRDSEISQIIKKYDIYSNDLEFYKLKKATDKEKYCQLNKPEIMNNGDDYSSIYYLGKTQNGYMYVGVFFYGFFGWCYVYKGWAPAQYLKVACKKCQGDGFVDWPDRCPKCHGRGY